MFPTARVGVVASGVLLLWSREESIPRLAVIGVLVAVWVVLADWLSRRMRLSSRVGFRLSRAEFVQVRALSAAGLPVSGRCAAAQEALVRSSWPFASTVLIMCMYSIGLVYVALVVGTPVLLFASGVVCLVLCTGFLIWVRGKTSAGWAQVLVHLDGPPRSF